MSAHATYCFALVFTFYSRSTRTVKRFSVRMPPWCYQQPTGGERRRLCLRGRNLICLLNSGSNFLTVKRRKKTHSSEFCRTPQNGKYRSYRGRGRSPDTLISLRSRERDSQLPSSSFDPLLQRPHHFSPKIGIEQSSDGELSDLESDRRSVEQLTHLHRRNRSHIRRNQFCQSNFS